MTEPKHKPTTQAYSDDRVRALFAIANELAELNANAALLIQPLHDIQETLEDLRGVFDQKLTTRDGEDLADVLRR